MNLKNGILFNSIRPDKWLVHEQLALLKNINIHLTTTEKLASEAQLRKWIKQTNKFVLKPLMNSQGKGIIIVEHKGAGKFEVFDYQKTVSAVRKTYSQRRLVSYLKKQKLQQKGYLIQEWIHLKRFEGRPFDIRVFVQKQSTCWFVNGLECRQALPSEEITNLSKGGQALRLNTVIGLNDYKRIKKQIDQISVNIAEALEVQFPEANITELGIDLAIDEKKGRLVLIEVNFRPGYKGLKSIDQKAYFN
ncbi:YheC/YheD family protein, partial [Bacillus sp. JCM 19041]|uniref:YheC/YheD family protein n=1 Tax=Bacillus sp. JCM 19041 TaxID=1460637 RepID=UPI000ABE4CF9